jgi:hypothetical protein
MSCHWEDSDAVVQEMLVTVSSVVFLTIGKQFNKTAAGLAVMYLYCVCRTDALKPLRVLSNEPSIMLLYPQLLNYMSRISLLECLRH